MLGTKKSYVTGDGNKRLYNLHSLSDSVIEIKRRWAGHVERIGKQTMQINLGLIQQGAEASSGDTGKLEDNIRTNLKKNTV
jgi:hypothetical protein